MSASRADWAKGWTTKVLEAGTLDTAELQEALGRLVFVYGALQWDKPFLAPTFRLPQAAPPGCPAEGPPLCQDRSDLVRERLTERRSQCLRTREVVDRAVLRVDAKAEGLAVAVGGWCPHYDAEGG